MEGGEGGESRESRESRDGEKPGEVDGDVKAELVGVGKSWCGGSVAGGGGLSTELLAAACAAAGDLDELGMPAKDEVGVLTQNELGMPAKAVRAKRTPRLTPKAADADAVDSM